MFFPEGQEDCQRSEKCRQTENRLGDVDKVNGSWEQCSNRMQHVASDKRNEQSLLVPSERRTDKVKPYGVDTGPYRDVDCHHEPSWMESKTRPCPRRVLRSYFFMKPSAKNTTGKRESEERREGSGDDLKLPGH